MKVGASLSPFTGMVTNADAADIPRGAAQFQENVQSIIQGQLVGRGGSIPCVYSNGVTPAGRAAFFNPLTDPTYPVMSMFNCHRPAGDAILYETTDGVVRMGYGARVVTPNTALSGYPIGTGFNTFARLCFTKDRRQNVYGVNGLQRGFRWDTMTAAVEQIGITAPLAAPTIALAGGGGASEGDYYLSYRYYDNTLPIPNYSSLSEDTVVTAAVNQKFNWSGLSVPTEARVAGVELYRSAVGAAGQNKRYLIANIPLASIAAGYTTDTSTDAALIAAAAAAPDTSLFIQYPNGQLCARRFELPPDFKKVMVMHQDRAWYMCDVSYTEGTATTNGTTTITGSNTAWTSAMEGRYLYSNAEFLPLLITAVGSPTSLTVSTAASSSLAGQAYSIRPDPSYRNAAFYSEQDEPESVPTSQNIVTIQQSGGNDEDEWVGAMPFGAVLYALFDRHIYTISSYSQPVLDADVRLLANRGAFNQRCWDIHEGVAYLMDAAGPYTMTPGGAIEPIGAAIQNYFRDNVNMAFKETFHVCCDPLLEVVRFFLVFTSDSVTYPKRAFVYNMRTKGWWLERYHCQFGDSAKTELNSRLRAIAGGPDQTVYFMGQGYTDGVQAQVRGTATGATSTTLTDTAASFTDLMIGAPVVIVSGTGKGQERIITARTGTQLTVATWTTIPSTDSVYMIGGVVWDYKGPRLQVEQSEEWQMRGVEVDFEPTTGTCTLDVRRYWNNDSTPENNVISETVPQTSNPLVTMIAGDPSQTVDLRLLRGEEGNSAGRALCPFAGRSFDRFESKQELILELTGVQGDEKIVIYDASIMGAK